VAEYGEKEGLGTRVKLTVYFVTVMEAGDNLHFASLFNNLQQTKA